MEKSDVIGFIESNSEIEVYHKYLIGQNVWYFQNAGGDYNSTYDDFKKFVSLKLDVPFNNISIVGSAKTKFSFSPRKNFKMFDHDSDFDLVIVSNESFRRIWKAYRNVAQQSYLHDYNRKCNDVFNGFVSLRDTDQTYGQSALVDWQRRVRTFKASLQLKFRIEHQINYRVYSDWESVQDYHVRGIAKIKGNIK